MSINSSLRIVYAGPLDESGTCLSRLNALREIQGDITAFDTQSYFKGKSFFQRFDRRFTFAGAEFRASNTEFLALCDQAKPELIWVDKGFWIWPSTLNTLRKRGVFLVQHNTDKLRPQNWSAHSVYKLMRRGLHFYHLYFTTNLLDYAELSVANVPPTELTYLGYDAKRFNSEPVSAESLKRFAADLLFVGHYEPRTERYILALMDAGLKVSVYGYGWEKARKRQRLSGAVHFSMLNAGDYERALKSAAIGLCFFSEWNGNQTSGRSFEITASGTFMLAMRSAQHLACYVEGEEAEFFSDEKELVAKAKFYLEHSDRRREIAQRGRERCLRSDYSWQRYMRDDWVKTLARYQRFMDAV